MASVARQERCWCNSGGPTVISVVMPYWRRPRELIANLTALRLIYPPWIEIVVVNDGSPDMPETEGAATVVNLPLKEKALNPCVPFNRGVEASSGEFVVLTNPEITHINPILDGMRAECERLGPKAYVAAACWSPSRKWWYCHSEKGPEPKKVGRAPMPKDAGLHFCSMLRRSFYDEIGGFSEEYRDGQGYEDSDLLWKLAAAGAAFKIRDDLVMEHVETTRSVWPKGGLARNRKIFERKWR